MNLRDIVDQLEDDINSFRSDKSVEENSTLDIGEEPVVSDD